MAQDNRLVQEFQNNSLIFDIGVATGPGGGISQSGIYGGAVMPYRQAPTGGLSDALAPLSGLAVPGETDRVNKHPINRVCLFENEIHNIGQGQWHKQNETTGAWELIIDIKNYQADTEYQHIGLYPIFNQQTNRRTLVTAYLTTNSNKWVALAYNKDDNTVVSGALSPNMGAGGSDLSTQDCQLGNDIYFMGSNTDSRVMVLNGTNLEISSSNVGTVQRPVDLCAYSGSVYMVHKDNSVGGGAGASGVVTISKITPIKSTVLRLPFQDLPNSYPTEPERGYAVADTSSSVPRQKCVLFVDNNPVTASGTPTMWLYYQNVPQINPDGVSGGPSSGAGTYGWSVWELEGDGIGGLSVIRQKDSLMGGYRAGLAESVIPIGNADQGVISFCDNYPGWFTTTPENGFLTLRPFGGEPGQTFHQWDFDPDVNPGIGGASLGGPTKVSFSQDKIGGGARWSPAATSTTTGSDVNIFDVAYTSGHFVGPDRNYWRIHYKLMPSTAYHAGTTVSVRWYYDKFHAPNKRCEIDTPGNSSHGTITSNQINGIVMSSGVDYWVDWDFKSQNFAAEDKLYLCPLVFIPAGSNIGSL